MADNAVCQGFEGRSISLPAKVWGLLERVKTDRQDPTLSDTIRVLLLQQLAEISYLEDREKKALRITTRNGLTSHGASHYPNPEIETRA
jgi:hypothetical protein